ncbi:MAG: hypothetical protein ACJ768_09455 [Gaiellaceae bacterium]
MAKPTAKQRLTALARQLRPEQPPFFERAELRPITLRRVYPATGWYWRPHGHPVAVFLGRNYDEARDELVELLRRDEATAMENQ